MHIMHIVGNFGPGGAEMGIVRLIKALSYPPFTHSVCSVSPDLRMKNLLQPEVGCYSLGIEGQGRLAFTSFSSIFRRAGVDIAHVNNIAPWFDVALASKLCRIRCIQTFHGVEDNTLKFSPLKRLQLFLSLRMSDCLTSVSGASADLLSRLSGFDKKQIKVIDNGIDTDFFSPAGPGDKKQIRKTLGLPEDRCIVGCVAALRPVKNHKGLLAAFSKVIRIQKDCLLVLVGDGPLTEELKKMSENAGLDSHVIFVGQRDNVEHYLKAFDIFVLNSKTEGLSYAILEAMASGLPIVATDVGGNSQIIDNGENGILYEQGDEKKLSEALIDIIKNQERLSRMGAMARKKVLEKYSLDAMVRQYDLLYKAVALSHLHNSE